VQTWIGLSLALVSAVAVNWAYTREHDAASKLPPLSPRTPLVSLRIVLRSRRWLVGFAVESGGWLLYVGAVRLAPLALVQAVAASGIAVLALITSRGRVSALARHEQLGVVLALIGLLLLSLSLTGADQGGHEPNAYAAFLWLGATAAAASLVIGMQTRISRAAMLGFAAGLYFGAGDISTKLVVLGGAWFLAIFALIACYLVGTMVLQSAFQYGGALVSAGIATLTTNAIPIAAGLVLFDEPLPGGIQRILRIAAFAAVVLGAASLADPRARTPEPTAQES
jgi:hypothetical protein